MLQSFQQVGLVSFCPQHRSTVKQISAILKHVNSLTEHWWHATITKAPSNIQCDTFLPLRSNHNLTKVSKLLNSNGSDGLRMHHFTSNFENFPQKITGLYTSQLIPYINCVCFYPCILFQNAVMMQRFFCACWNESIASMLTCKMSSCLNHLIKTHLGKFLTPMCLCSPSSVSWYRPKGGAALRLGSKGRYGLCVGGR